MTNDNQELVERIVADVMGQLRTESAPVRSQSDNELADRSESRLVGNETGLILSESVVTAELLQSRLNGEKCIRLGPNSILTPSARDLLYAQKIDWCRADLVAADVKTGHWLAITIQSTSATAAALDEIARAGGAEWRREIVGLPTECVELAVSALCRADADGVVVFAEQAELIACRSNRNKAVRAAVVDDVASVQNVKRTMGANLMAVNAAGKSYFILRNILRAFIAGGPAEVPANWE